MNQARSAFAQAAIFKFFPGFHVSSAGLQAVNGISYISEVVSIARGWGIEISTGPSRSLNSSPDFRLADLIICAEEWITAEVQLMGPGGRVVSYESVVPDTSFVPVDPERLRGRYLETELAKVAWVNIRAVAEFMKLGAMNQISAIIPETELDVAAVMDRVLEERMTEGVVVIDADLRSPLARNFRARGLTVGSFGQLNQRENFDVFSSIVEQDEPGRVLLSDGWSAMLNSLGTERQILLVTGPQMTQGGPLPDSYLAAIPAGQIEIIRS